MKLFFKTLYSFRKYFLSGKTFYKKGFSIIELLAAISIATVLSYIAFTSYSKHIRKGRQVEAKHHLGLAYSRQLSYYASEQKLQPNLKTIGAVPSGGIRYNIGTDWKTPLPNNTPLGETKLIHSGNSGDTNDLCPCAGSPPTGKTCFSLPAPDKKFSSADCGSSFNKCFGKSTDSFSTQLGDIGVPASEYHLPSSGFNHGNVSAQFEYYAIGCTSHSLRALTDLDVWSINHKKKLENVKSGI